MVIKDGVCQRTCTEMETNHTLELRPVVVGKERIRRIPTGGESSVDDHGATFLFIYLKSSIPLNGGEEVGVSWKLLDDHRRSDKANKIFNSNSFHGETLSSPASLWGSADAFVV